MMEIITYLAVATAITFLGFRFRWAAICLFVAVTTTLMVITEIASFSGVWQYMGLMFVLTHWWIALKSVNKR